MTVEGAQTVWWVVRERPGSDRAERLEIARIDSAATDFDQLFVVAERRAHDRALMLNSALSP